MSSPLSLLSQFTNSKELRKLFSPKKLEELARRTSFMERCRKLTASAFVHLCTFFEGADAYPTLEQMKAELLRFRIGMCKSSISERFVQSAVDFMRVLFKEVLATEFSRRWASQGLCQFADVIVADSSIFNLHSKCKDAFKGSGGGASDAAAKIQLCFGLVTSMVYELFLRQGVQSDSSHRFRDIVANALYLFDLGYFGADNFKAIMNGGAWFLSRYRYGTNLYRMDGRPITKRTLDRLVRRLKAGQTVDIQVLLSEQKIPVRLVLHKLPKPVGDEIRRKLRADKQKKCKDMSAERMAFCDVNAYITNLSEQQLPADRMRQTYGLRWQVEIMFKTWKSGMDMDKVGNIGPMQFQCMIYGHLIRMLLCCRIFWKTKLICWKEKGVELSEIKGIKLLATLVNEIRKWLVTRKRKNGGFLSEIWELLTKTCLKEAKKGDFTPFETIRNYA
jgi:Transposase DDE domain